MSISTQPVQESGVPATLETDSYAAKRIERAAKNSMVVESYNGAAAMYRVYNVRGEDYVVDLLEEVCDCPDYRNRERKCKHQYRVEMHLGLRPIPEEFGRCDARLMREIALRKAAEAREDGAHPIGVSRAEQAAIENDSGTGAAPGAVATDGGREVGE